MGEKNGVRSTTLMEHGRRDPGWRDSLINNQIFIDHFLWTSHHDSKKKEERKKESLIQPAPSRSLPNLRRLE